MFPLLKRDGLQIPFYIVCAIFLTFNYAYHLLFIQHQRDVSLLNVLNNAAIAVSSAGMLLLLMLEAWLPPPDRYPDLYPALFSIYGAMNLSCALLVFMCWQLFLDEDGTEAKKLS